MDFSRILTKRGFLRIFLFCNTITKRGFLSIFVYGLTEVNKTRFFEYFANLPDPTNVDYFRVHRKAKKRIFHGLLWPPKFD